jgi:hypothetical protein
VLKSWGNEKIWHFSVATAKRNRDEATELFNINKKSDRSRTASRAEGIANSYVN